MSWLRGTSRLGWFTLPTLTRRSWLVLGAGLVFTLALGAPLVGSAFVAGAIAVIASFALVLGLVTLIEWSDNPAGPRLAHAGFAPSGGAFGRVPASWEYFETFGR